MISPVNKYLHHQGRGLEAAGATAVAGAAVAAATAGTAAAATSGKQPNINARC